MKKKLKTNLLKIKFSLNNGLLKNIKLKTMSYYFSLYSITQKKNKKPK